MIKVLKETPITVNDVDCLELHVQDDSMWCQDVCDHCVYHDWHDDYGCCASCCEVHGCDLVKPDYFILTDL